MGHNLRLGVCAQRTDPFWLQVEEAIHRRAKSLPVHLVHIRASEGQGSFLDLELVPAAEDLLALDLDALLGWIWPDEHLYQVLAAGLPVIHLGETSVSHPLLVSPRGLSAAARKAATYLAGRLGGQGRVLVVGGLSSDCPHDRGRKRLAGVRQVLAGQPGIRLTHVPSSWDPQFVWQQMRGDMGDLEGGVDAVLGLSDALALAARDALRSMDLLPASAPVVGIDGDPQALAAIANGAMAATAALFPEEIGARALDLAYRAARQRSLSGHLRYRSTLVTAQNLTDAMARQLTMLSRLPTWLAEVNQQRQQQRLSQLEASLEIIAKIRSMFDSHRQLREIAELICTRYDYDRARIYRWVEEERCLYLVHPGSIGSMEVWYGLVGGGSKVAGELLPGTEGTPPPTSGEPAETAGAGRLMIADGLGWVGEWYGSIGASSNYVIDQSPAWATPESKAFAQAFEARYGLQPSPSAAGLSHDYAKMFLAIARQVYQESGELSSEALASFSRHKLQTGEWSYSGGFIMEEYRYAPETLPDPVVGPGYFAFPVVEYLEGEGMMVFPEEWAERKAAPPSKVRVRPAGEEPAREEVTEPFRLGVLGPFSGHSACTGAEIRGAVEMALESIDYRIGRYKIEVVWIDSQSDPVRAARAYEEAIVRKGIRAGLLGWHTSVATPCMELAARHKIPHFFGLGGGSVINETWQSDPDRYFYWLKGWPAPAKLTANYVQAIQEAIARGLWRPEEKRAAIWGDETDWSRSFAASIREQLEAAGWEIVAESYFALGQTDFVPMLQEIKALNPALIAGTTMNPPAFSSLVRQAAELGLERMVAWSPGNQPSIPLEESGVLGQALLRNEPIYLPHGQRDHQPPHEGYQGPTRSRLVLPIRRGDQVLGLLDLRSHRSTWHTRLELVGLRALSDQLGAAMWDAQLYGQAVQARAVAEQSDQLKTHLLASVSHELRTPLHVILGYIGRAVNSLAPHQADLPPALLNDLQQIQRTAGDLLRLTDDLLDLARAEVHQLEISPRIVDLRPLLIDLFQAVADVAPSTAVSWRLQLPQRLPVIRADPGRLRQVLLNLLSNAERFTARGQIVLGADVAPPCMHIWVRDTGVGIPIEHQKRVFEPFVSEEPPGRRSAGVGLGLPIARQLVALHSGFMALDSQPGQGSTFHVYLPLPNLAEEPRLSPPPSQPVLLLVSAGQEPAPELEEFCRRQGLEIHRLEPTAGLDEMLDRVQPAALAWDLSTPDAGQRALIERLRSRPSLCLAPFLVYGQATQPDAGETGGLTNFLVKPVEAKTLAEAMRAMCPLPAAGPVLVVDDDPRACAYLAGLVEQEFPGWAVRTAGDGASALESVAQQVPSLVVLDLIMPGIDGFQVLEQLRAGERTCRVPILILTGHLLTLEDIKRLEQYALVTIHSKGLLSDGELVAAMHRSLFGTETLPPHTGALVKRTVAYLQQHYDAPLTRAKVAGAVGVSENYLSQIFRKELGLTPWEYLTRYRIKRAERLLLGSEESITNIAVRTGFRDPNFFGRVFRKETGRSPTAFRAARPAPD